MLRPWIPRLYLKMTAGLRSKLSSEGVTIKKKDPITGKVTVSAAQCPKFCGRVSSVKWKTNGNNS